MADGATADGMVNRDMTEIRQSDIDARDADEGRELVGLLAEFEDVDALVGACEKVRDAGYTRWDSLTPFPIHGIEEAMGIKRTILPVIVFGAGATGTMLALLLTWYTHSVDYRLIISGKPMFALPAYIPILFEVTVLFAALTAFTGMLVLNGLPQLYHPLFRVPSFSRVTDNSFFIYIESRDPKFDRQQTAALLEQAGCTQLEEVEDE